MANQDNLNQTTLRGAGRPARQRGASLLEALAYLGIAAVVVLGAVSLLTSAFGSAKSNQSSEEVVALRTAVHKLYLGQTYPAGNLLPTLLTANAVPATLTRGAANAVTNSWAGAVTVTGNTSTFTVTYNGVPQDVCVGMVSGANGWSQIDQGGNAPITTFPATAAAAAAVCANAAGNSVTFTGT
ncbi:type 4 pilus major pilin [Duganella sp. Dugasp56]|jgi:Tfp pilus assembly protein PilV|uniref:type 4 pilus major pilin n=1 Tax=unclassified Duganella TaxID=2636909 RepID=UPI00159D3984